VRLSALHPPLIGGTELLLSRRPLVSKPRGLAGGRESEGTCEETDNPGAPTRRGNEQHCAVWHRESGM